MRCILLKWRLIKCLTVVSLLCFTTRLPAPIWAGDDGDPLRFMFHEAKSLAYRIISEAHIPNSFAAQPLNSWLEVHRIDLLTLVASSRHGWVKTELPMTSCFKPSWANIDEPDIACEIPGPLCGPILYLSFERCAVEAKTRADASIMLIGAACLQVGATNGAFCDSLATQLYLAWDAKQSQPIGHWVSTSLAGSPFYQLGKTATWIGDRLVKNEVLVTSIFFSC